MIPDRPARHVLTIDLEEHFHASRFDSPMRRRGWSSYESRAVANVERLLDMLALRSTRATFFALGWLAEQHPALVRTISAAGHEIACLGYGHELVAAQSPRSFRLDIRHAKQILENVTGRRVVGFRAPSLSITAHTPWALPIVAEEGFLYDSSVLPVMHDLAGVPGANEWIHELSFETHRLWEIPPSTVNVGGFRLPIGGGGYLRALSYSVLQSLLARIEDQNRPIVAYLRLWEIDAGQPRMQGPLLSRLRHYKNLDKTAGRLDRLLGDFQFGPVCEVVQPVRDRLRSSSEPAPPFIHNNPVSNQMEERACSVPVVPV